MNGSQSYRVGAAFVLAMLAGCAAPGGQHAPVIDRSVSAKSGKTIPVRHVHPPEKDWRPQVYVVQKGDTLYSIALNFGFDYRELAELNGIRDPAVIQAGQEIRLFPAAGGVAATGKPATEARPTEIKTQPVVGILPYSEQAVAQVENMQVDLPKVEIKPPQEVKHVRAENPPPPSGGEADESIQWEMPTNGKVVAGFSEGDNRKGVDIAGKLGQPIFASAAGKVVYSGSGLRGYGKLVIIKHNSTYLSAYAHNNKVLVKEGQSVAKGQKIAEMGSTDANSVVLHFEIRRLGKPVDPAKYLPFSRS